MKPETKLIETLINRWIQGYNELTGEFEGTMN